MSESLSQRPRSEQRRLQSTVETYFQDSPIHRVVTCFQRDGKNVRAVSYGLQLKLFNMFQDRIQKDGNAYLSLNPDGLFSIRSGKEGEMTEYKTTTDESVGIELCLEDFIQSFSMQLQNNIESQGQLRMAFRAQDDNLFIHKVMHLYIIRNYLSRPDAELSVLDSPDIILLLMCCNDFNSRFMINMASSTFNSIQPAIVKALSTVGQLIQSYDSDTGAYTYGALHGVIERSNVGFHGIRLLRRLSGTFNVSRDYVGESRRRVDGDDGVNNE